MRKIYLNEQKDIIINMLDYIDKICDEHSINYSLIGGSLIGAIRHKGFIPWDDDIDIILLPNEYKKLIDLLSESNDYLLLEPNNNDDYFYPFAKLISCETVLIENRVKRINNYGVYLDIFQYHYVSNNKLLRFIHYKSLVFIKVLLTASVLLDEEVKKEKNFLKKLRNFVARKIGTRKLKKKYLSLCNSKKETNYILANWPCYGFKQEIQKASDFKHFKKVKFETIKALITTDYDQILKTTFNDYMKLPPKNQRVSNHDTKVYWRDEDEKIKK